MTLGNDVDGRAIKEFSQECPRCEKFMEPVVAVGRLGFQKCMVPAFRCDCQEVDYPLTSEEELQGWVALVVLAGPPKVMPMEGAKVSRTVMVCRDCEGELSEGGNPYEDGWFCPGCGTYELDPKKVQIDGD